VPEPEALRWCIGPPLRQIFKKLLQTDDPTILDEAIGHYRERYGEVGKFENTLIDGVPDVLRLLASDGLRLHVATSKMTAHATDIVTHFGLRPYFGTVYGSAPDGSNAAKTELIRQIIAAEAIDPAATVMIGDRSHDVVGATANGVRTIGVRWGYAEPDELEAAGAVSIASHPRELPDLIRAALADR